MSEVKDIEQDIIEVFLQGERIETIDIVKLPIESRVRDIAVIHGEKMAIPVIEVLVFEEDMDVPLDPDLTLTKDANKVHHVHRAHKIEVIVYYLDKSKERAFSPATRVQTVLDWGVGRDGLNIDPTIAPEMELTKHGETAPLPKDAHIGRYAHHPHNKLELDLIRGVIPNGGES